MDTCRGLEPNLGPIRINSSIGYNGTASGRLRHHRLQNLGRHCVPKSYLDLTLRTWRVMWPCTSQPAPATSCLRPISRTSLTFLLQMPKLHLFRPKSFMSIDGKVGIRHNFIFQDDSDVEQHTALKRREWVLYNVPNQLASPPQPPELNTIQRSSFHLNFKVRKQKVPAGINYMK
ncbi:unnamed protein product [Nezara viridula]|uniref:Uncharacterized protein n=1 Tax=Nezara viridula TaxID=85310 RepID=A0A9P0MWY5_NEZVI|nr:unnamed protein product [Nezara viridula]